MSYGQRPRQLWRRLFQHLGRFGQASSTQWTQSSRRRGQRTGGGNTDMRPAKFLSMKLVARTHHPEQSERNQRRSQRQRTERRPSSPPVRTERERTRIRRERREARKEARA